MRGTYWFHREKPKTPANPELKDLVGAANEVAKTARDVLTAMLVVALTLAATMIAATDEALLRDSAEVFPGLGAKVKLSTVFLLAPIVFTFLHANALLQLHLLAGRVRALDEEMKAQGLDENARKPWRRLIHGFAFAQLLAGDDSHGGGWGEWLHRVLLAFVSWLTIVLVPVGLLVCAQVSFVRYQSDIITHVHQGMVGLDLVLLAWFHTVTWGRVTGAANIPKTVIPTTIGRRNLLLTQLFRTGTTSPGGDPSTSLGMTGWGRVLASATWSLAALLSAGGLVWLCGTQALPPGPEEDAGAIRRDGLRRPATLSDRACRLPGLGWTCRSLDLSNRTLVDNDAKPDLLKPFAEDGSLKKAQRKMVALDLQGRTLRFANFTGAQLFSADLREIRAERSIWHEARLEGASLFKAHLQGASLYDAQLQGAGLSLTNLQGADLSEAHLQGAILAWAILLDADLNRTHLQGAILYEAHLQGAFLYKASLQGANLILARLQGADLSQTHLHGADMSRASLQLAVGWPEGCELALWQGLSTDALSRDDLAALLKQQYGLGGTMIEGIKNHLNGQPAASCNGKPLGQRPHPDVEDFAAARVKAACSHKAAASRTISGFFDSYLPPPYHVAFKTAWAAETCPAVMAIKRERGEVQ